MTKGLRVFTIAYGEPWLNSFEHAVLPSLMWPRNHAALLARKAVWDVWTTPGNEARFEAMAARFKLPLVLHPDMGIAAQQVTKAANLICALQGELRLAFSTGSGILFACAKLVLGEGSIPALLGIGEGANTCVALGTMHVNEAPFRAAMDAAPKPLSNAQLVKMSWAHMHAAFANNNLALPRTSCFVSGSSWREIGPGLYAVQWRIPSVFYLQPMQCDVEWFDRHPKFGSFDHQYPEILVNQQRHRLVGSSDAVFAVQLCDPACGATSLFPTDPAEPDRYEKSQAHHIVNRNTACIWRAEL